MEEEDDLPTLLRELDTLPGLTNVKDIVKEQTALVALNQERELRHLPPVPVNRHMVFTGEPGTGKTTIARLVGKIYKAMGVLRTGHLVETDRAGLIGQYLGSTVAKTTKTITSALGGVLFIDEAYALIEQGFTKGDAFGAEAVNTLVKAMEDHRHDLVVILAGYPEEMHTFIHTNPGLASRIGRTVHFNTYTPDELVHILHHHTRTHHLTLTPEAETAALKVFTDRTFHGNGRGVRNLLEAATASLATRLHTTPTTDLDDTTLTTLHQCDIDTAATKLDTTPRTTPIGFITN